MKVEDGDAFADEMPLSFRLWKPSMQTQAAVPKAIGKAAVGYVLSCILLLEGIISGFLHTRGVGYAARSFR